MLKMDCEGYELEVLAGASGLARVAGIYIEMSLVGMYHGGRLIEGMLADLRRDGVEPISIDLGYYNPRTLEQPQADVLLRRA
jgi:Methyltransferase FkbM domain